MNYETPATRRGSLRSSVVRALAPVPPRPSVLPPGAGNEEAKKALKADEERAQKAGEREIGQTGVANGHRDTAAITGDDDGDVAAIESVEPSQAVSAPGVLTTVRECPAV
jgi:hypothetical protein